MSVDLIARWRHSYRMKYGEPESIMVRASDGDYVLHSEAAARIEALEAQLAECERQLQAWMARYQALEAECAAAIRKEAEVIET